MENKKRFDSDLNVYVGERFIVSPPEEDNVMRIGYLRDSFRIALSRQNFKQMVQGLLLDGLSEQELKEALVIDIEEMRERLAG